MPEPEPFRYRPDDRESVERDQLNQGGGGGSSGGSSGGGSSSGGSSGSSGSNPMRDTRGRFYQASDAPSGTDGQKNSSPIVDNLVHESQDRQRPARSEQGYQPNYSQGLTGQKEDSPMTHNPTVIAAGMPGFATPYAPWGYPYGAPVAPAASGPVTVVSGADHGHGSARAAEANGRLDVVGDLVVGNQLQAAQSGHFAQLGNAVNAVGDRIDTQGEFVRAISNLRETAEAERRVSRELSDIRKDACDIRAQVGDVKVTLLNEFKDMRIRELENQNNNLRDSRRTDELAEILKDIRREVRRNDP